MQQLECNPRSHLEVVWLALSSQSVNAMCIQLAVSQKVSRAEDSTGQFIDIRSLNLMTYCTIVVSYHSTNRM